jgi:transcriptional regulator with XRE-family HTH domain
MRVCGLTDSQEVSRLHGVSTKYRTLSEYLDATGTRQEDFATRIGIGAPYVSMLANGQRTPSLPLAVRIAAEAHIPIESLLPVPPTADAATSDTEAA